MQLGLYLNSQHPVTDDPGDRLAGLVEQVRMASELGLDQIWAGEHHLTPGFHFFPQLALLSRLAADANGMAMGTNVVLLPLHRPVDIAEQVAMLDIMCGGRFVLAVGQGYRPEEFAAMGVPFEERLLRLVEGIDVLRRLWTEDEVTYEGSWFSLEGASVLPKPTRAGGPPIWVGATTPRAIRRAAVLGDGFMGTPNAANDEVLGQLQLFAAARQQAGLAPAAGAGRMLEVHCHASGQEARRRAAPHLLTKYAAYASWGLTGSAGRVAHQAAGADDADRFTELARDRFVIGDPDEVTAGLVDQHERLGVTHVAMRVAWPGSSQAETLACIELLGREVLPAVRATVD